MFVRGKGFANYYFFRMGKEIKLSSFLLLKLKEPQQGLRICFFFFFLVTVLLHIFKILSNNGPQIYLFLGYIKIILVGG